MSWLAKLYETYEVGVGLDLPETDKLMPISHTLQNAHINIIIDGQGNFKRASVLEKTQIVLPATESSAGRSSGEAPHPLADKIQYVAKDYSEYGWRKRSYFSSYEKLLTQWCESAHAHPKAMAVYKYIRKGRVVEDLIAANVLHAGENNKLLAYWSFETDKENPAPLIFKVLPVLPKEKRINEDFAEIEQGDALICWTVEKEGELDSSTWNDQSLQQSWVDYDATSSGKPELCFVTGQDRPLALNHPAKLRHTGDKAKLVSSNDSSGFTFRGRFTDAEGNQAVGVSFEVTQKAHNALRWLISRQGYRNGDQAYVAWAISGKPIPAPLEDAWSLLGKPLAIQMDNKEPQESHVDHCVDLGQSFAYQFNKYLAGYRSRFELNDQIVVMGLDSATPGRMGIIYYRELLASDFFQRIEKWHTQFAWPQRHTIELPNSKEGKKPINKTIWPVSSPVPRSIADAAYGDILKSNDTLRKSLHERILPCIVDGRPFPRDILDSAMRRAANRNSCEHWEWERNLGVACALFRGFHQRHPDINQRRIYAMTLEEANGSRDYLYGRLLAIAERIEEIALSVGGENRPTTAARMMQRFADRPSSTWRNIELGLQPYMQRLQSSRPGFLANRKKELDAVTCAFHADDFSKDKSLSGEFLLGYHCQRMAYRNTQSESIQED
jgi:CRISPR-associated protein Csd1